MSKEPRSDLGTEQLRQRNRELAILHSIAEALNHEVDLTRALGVAGFGPITDPAKLGEVLDEAINSVRNGKPGVVDERTQAR